MNLANGPESSSLRRARHIDDVCDRFERAWQAHAPGVSRPALDSFLNGNGAGDRAILLRELLAIDLYYRRQRGEHPRPSDYQFHKAELDPLWFDEPRDVELHSTPRRGKNGQTLQDAAVRAVTPLHEGIPRDFAGYELIEEIARGGMGVVYRARHRELQRVVALKMILSGELATEEEVQRFRAEAEAAASLDHPHIVPVYEVGTWQGRHYYTMKLVAGTSLREELPALRGRFRDIALLMMQVAEAVQYAHSRAVLHRDIKPANILIGCQSTDSASNSTDQKGEESAGDQSGVYVTDFGLSKRLGSTDRTRTGAVVGTPAYMSPEQAAGGSQRVGTAADVYGMGAVLYELITGRTPFVAADVLTLLSQVSQGDPATPRSIVPTIPRDLETICMKCLRKAPQERYASAAALAEDLRCFAEGKPVSARPVNALERLAKWGRRRPAVAALAAILLIVAGAGTSLVMWQWQQAVFHEREKGRALKDAETALAAYRRSDYVQRIARADMEVSANNIAIANQILEGCPEDLRDWEWNYLKSQCHTELLEFQAHEKSGRSVCFSADGRKLATGDIDGEICVWGMPSAKKLLTIQTGSPVLDSLAFHPDGTRLYAASGDYRRAGSAVGGIWDARTGQRIAALEGLNSHIWRLALSRDGSTLVGTQGRNVVTWDALNGKKIGSIAFPSPTLSVAFHPDGKQLAVGLRSGEIHITSLPHGAVLVKLPAHNDPEVRDLMYNHDGSELVTRSFRGQVRLWFIGKQTYRLLLSSHVGQRSVNHAAFSPNGQIVAASQNGAVLCWPRHLLDQWDRPQVLTGDARGTFQLAFSPGNQLLATIGWEGKVRLWELAGKQALPRDIRSSGVHAMVLFPEGDRLLTIGKPVPRQGISQEGKVILWEVGTQQPLMILEKRPGGYDAMALHPAGQFVAVAAGGEVTIWDMRTLSVHQRWTAHDQAITALCYRGRTGSLVTGTVGGEVAEWHLDAGLTPGKRLIHQFAAEISALSARHEYVAGGCANGLVWVWDGDHQRVTRTWKAQVGEITCVVFRPGQSQIAATCVDQTVYHHDLLGSSSQRFKAHQGAVLSAAYNPTGTRLATVSTDGDLILWDANTGEPILNVRKRLSSPVGVTFSPDGQRLIGLKGYRHRFLGELAGDQDSGLVVWANRFSGEDPHQALERALEGDQETVGMSRQSSAKERTESGDDETRSLIQLAYLRAEAGAWSEAESLLMKAISRGAVPGVLEGEGSRLTRLCITLGTPQQRQAAVTELLKRYPTSGSMLMVQRGSWLIALRPGQPLEDYRQAVGMATRTVTAEPDKYYHWVTLSLAQLRAGAWQDSMNSASRAASLSTNHDCAESFVLALANWQLGRQEEARRWYSKGATWMEANREQSKQTRFLDRLRLQAEAAQLLGMPIPSQVLGWRD